MQATSGTKVATQGEARAKEVFVPTSVASVHFHVTQRTVQRWVRQGLVKAKRTKGGHLRIGLTVNRDESEEITATPVE